MGKKGTAAQMAKTKKIMAQYGLTQAPEQHNPAHTLAIREKFDDQPGERKGAGLIRKRAFNKRFPAVPALGTGPIRESNFGPRARKAFQAGTLSAPTSDPFARKRPPVFGLEGIPGGENFGPFPSKQRASSGSRGLVGKRKSLKKRRKGRRKRR